ncbi:tRNA pseudouridine(55) synthase TruB [Candidatus Kaiserbacteria bacterium]|nr:tRNA pseudouridine(55) synthase TruB [Candidatus Kaiserbacteria bacterium]
MSELPEILLVDKPKGITSFDVIRKLRRQTGLKKFGHAGTLDPLATGLMLVGVGKGTKLLTNLIKLDKEYIAEILLGESRTTGDMEGEVVEAKVIKTLPDNFVLERAVLGLVGTLSLTVSAYSAIKVDGKAMYKRAREAEDRKEVISELPVREMRVYEAEILKPVSEIMVEGEKRGLLVVRFKVASGTYIRSLAEELGKMIGLPATLYNLRRTKVGEYNIKEALSLEEIK